MRYTSNFLAKYLFFSRDCGNNGWNGKTIFIVVLPQWNPTCPEDEILHKKVNSFRIFNYIAKCSYYDIHFAVLGTLPEFLQFMTWSFSAYQGNISFIHCTLNAIPLCEKTNVF